MFNLPEMDKGENMDIENVAKAMVNIMGIKIAKIDKIPAKKISDYDVLGFNPGVYAFNDNKDLIGFIEENGLSEQEHIHILRVSAEGREIDCSNPKVCPSTSVSNENKTP